MVAIAAVMAVNVLACSAAREVSDSMDEADIAVSPEAASFTKKLTVLDDHWKPIKDDPKLPEYQKELGKMYDLAPPFVKKVLNSLEGFDIGPGDNDAFSSDHRIGLHRRVFGEGDFISYSSRYEQQVLVGRTKGKVVKTLPHIVEAKGLKSLTANLLALVAHEVGHVLIFKDDAAGVAHLRMEWNREFRATTQPIDRRTLHPILRDLCYEHGTNPDGCTDQITDAEAAFTLLNSLPYPTFFALHSSEEDFCESMYHYVLSKVTNAIIWRLPTSGQELNALERFQNPRNEVEKMRLDTLKAYEARILAE